jgi:hypothetical protein
LSDAEFAAEVGSESAAGVVVAAPVVGVVAAAAGTRTTGADRGCFTEGAVPALAEPIDPALPVDRAEWVMPVDPALDPVVLLEDAESPVEGAA